MSKFFGFKGDYSGLTDNQAVENQIKYGMNELSPEKKKNLFIRILGVFKEPMFILLFCTAIIYFFLGEARDGIIMLCFVTFMTGISFIQEWRTDKTLEALKELASPRIRVVRNNSIINIESKEITINDLMILEEGEKIPADARIIEMFDFGVDESSLTGEAEIVWKKVCSDNDVNKNTEDFWRKDVCYAGTTVIQGSAIAKVISIGKDTQYGKIGLDIQGVPERPTPLEKQTRHLVKICALIGLGFFILVSLITLIHTGSIVDSILSGITLAMAMIPEEFPVVLTVFLAMGAWRLAKKNSLVRKMPSVETLGSVSVLCVDKTGTLTKNQMTVKETCPHNGFAANELGYWAALACETEPYDPMEKAILNYIENNGADKEDVFKNPLLFEYSFSSDTKMMGHVWSIENSATLAAKGSPESILPLCCLTKEAADNVAEQQTRLASKGYRVIAVARSIDIKEYPDTLKECKLDFVGLIGLQDPPRDEVLESIKVCKSAGLRVVMITGDNGITAQSIAREIGISHSSNVITGPELELMPDEVLLDKVKDTNIFARVMPRHKMRIVKALRDNGEIVAMTGDGVNDAPALKYADIGIAMGKRGTGVAKEASDMILLDDNFTTIVESVGDGRRIYDNIRKAIEYILVIHIPIALLALLAPLLHMPLVLLPVNVVLLELIIDPTCSIVFERLPAEKDIMHRKPRSNNEALITGSLILKSILQGLIIFAAAFGAFTYFFKSGAGESEARTFAVLVLGLSNLLLVYINQSDTEFAFRNMVNFKDKVVITVNSIIIAVLIIITYVPAVNGIVQTAPLSAKKFLLAIAISVVATMWWEIVKLIKRRKIQ